MTAESPFTTGGPVHTNKTKIYIHRAADEQLLENCLTGEYSVILTARQMGKTSLLQHTMGELRKQGVTPVFIDLNSIGTGGVSAVDWYKSILQIICESLNFQFDIEAWWKDASGSMSVKFSKFMTDVAIQKVDKNIVVFIDEIELTTQLEFSDSFFAVIRSMYSARSTNEILKRLSFVLVGMARISDLIRQADITTFNIGKRIDLENFSATEIFPLIQRIPNSNNNLRELTAWVMEWTGGQPYLTQLICETLCNAQIAFNSTFTKEYLDNIITSLLSQPEIKDKHFSTIQRYLVEKNSIIFGIYALLLRGEKVDDTDALLDLQYLKLAGIVKVGGEKLLVSNRIYTEALGVEWVATQLKRRKTVLDLESVIKATRETLLSLEQVTKSPFITVYSDKDGDIDSRDASSLDIENPKIANTDTMIYNLRKETGSFFDFEDGEDENVPIADNVRLKENMADWWSSRQVEKTSLGDRVARQLARANIKLKVGEYFALVISCSLICGLLGWHLGSQSTIAGMIGIVVGTLTPGFYVNRKLKRRQWKFQNQLEDMLALMINAMRAGYSTLQAMETVSKELPAPISDEFRYVVQEVQIGISMEKALDNLLRRIPLADLDKIITVLNFQREVGGNLSEILSSLDYRLRDRKLVLLQSKRLEKPSLLFFVGSSAIALILHFWVFPNSINTVNNYGWERVFLFSILCAWGLVLASRLILQIRKNILLNEL